jgi:hypothetical protein
VEIGAVYSHLNGYEWLRYRKPGLWDEIESVISSIDAEVHRTKNSLETKKVGSGALYSPISLNAAFKSEFEGSGWGESRVSYWVTANEDLARRTLRLEPAEQKQQIEDEGSEAIASYNQTDFVKDRVAVEVQFGKYAFVAYDLFVKHVAFYTQNEIDCGIEILPMKAMTRLMSSGIGYYEGEVYNVIRQGRGVPAVPLVVLGVQP